MTGWYILDEQGNPVPCEDHGKRREWIASLPEEQRTSGGCKVAYDTNGRVSVSTVFLGLDHGWQSDVPIVFETMVFGGPNDQECERYATWKEAEKGHQKFVSDYLSAS